MLIRRATAVALALTLFWVSPASSATIDVAVRDNRFDRDDVTVAVGDTVVWTNAARGNPHNVRQNRTLFRSGNPSASFVFASIFSSGVYPYFCEVHGFAGGGMDGTVRVPVKISRKPSGLPFTVHWANDRTNTGQVFDVQFRIGNGAWRTWRTDTSTFRGVFGRNGDPVPVQEGVTYSFRARSQFGTDTPRRVSGWSPVRSFVANYSSTTTTTTTTTTSSTTTTTAPGEPYPPYP